MGLYWNEIKSRALLFRTTWEDACKVASGDKKSYASDVERVTFLFDLYQRITSVLPPLAAKKTRKSKAEKKAVEVHGVFVKITNFDM